MFGCAFLWSIRGQWMPCELPLHLSTSLNQPPLSPFNMSSLLTQLVNTYHTLIPYCSVLLLWPLFLSVFCTCFSPRELQSFYEVISSCIQLPTHLTMLPVSMLLQASPAKRWKTRKMSDDDYSDCTSNFSEVFSEATRLDIRRMTTSKCFSCLSTLESDRSVSFWQVLDILVLIIVDSDRCCCA